MKTFRIIIPLILLFFGFSLSGQKIFISGSGQGYQNAELKFYSQTDPVTKRLKPLINVTCDDKGAFSCELICSKSEPVYIKTGIYKLRLIISDSTRYILLLPQFEAKPGNEEQNPFFIETEFIPEVVNNKNDINNLIRDFDSEFNQVFNLAADIIFRNSGKVDISKEIPKLDRYSDVKDPPFYSDYVKCRMLMLKLVISSTVINYSEAHDFLNERFSSGNQAFNDLSEQMFSGYFSKISSGPHKDSFGRAVAIASFSELRSVILREGKISNNELADFIILMNLNTCYYEQSLPGENVRKIISLMRNQGETTIIKNSASAVLDKINSSLAGNYPPDFSLLNSDGKLKTLKDFRGKYLLLGFARSDYPSSVMEMGIISMWQKKYSNDLNIVTVLTDKDFKTALLKLNNLGFNWNFLDGSERDILEFNYDLKMYPSFLLLSREGKMIANPCSFPSEKLEQTIAKILLIDSARSGTENR
jgi:hypothetical protein